MSDATRTTVPKRRPEAAFRVIDGQAMIAVAGRSEVHLLNATGTFILSQVNGTRTGEEIAQALAEEFDVPAATAIQDVQEFIERLTKEGVLE